jgi:hypothetical protein
MTPEVLESRIAASIRYVEEKAAAVVPIRSAAQPLYEVVDHLAALFDTLEGCEEAGLREQIQSDIDACLAVEIQKVDGLTGYLAHLENQQAFRSSEMARLSSLNARDAKQAERIKAYCIDAMIQTGTKKLEGRTSSLKLHPCPPSVEVYAAEEVPEQFKRFTVTESVDKVAVKAAIKAKQDVPGCRLAAEKFSLVRK